jgi:hypothetical protein
MASSVLDWVVDVPPAGRIPGGSCHNLNERNAESLYSLGLDKLFNVRVSPIEKDGQVLPTSPEEDRAARAKTMLEAHEALIITAPENLPKFKDVVQLPQGSIAFVQMSFIPHFWGSTGI